MSSFLRLGVLSVLLSACSASSLTSLNSPDPASGLAPRSQTTSSVNGVSGDQPGVEPTACTTDDGQAGVLDCAGSCQPVEWLGDGVCDDGTDGADFNCELLGGDRGDCADGATSEPDEGEQPPAEQPPAEEPPTDEPAAEEPPDAPGSQDPGTPCDVNGEAGVLDCNGSCAPADWVADGVCDDAAEADFMCAEFGDDGGDCEEHTGGSGGGQQPCP